MAASTLLEVRDLGVSTPITGWFNVSFSNNCEAIPISISDNATDLQAQLGQLPGMAGGCIFTASLCLLASSHKPVSIFRNKIKYTYTYTLGTSKGQCIKIEDPI